MDESSSVQQDSFQLALQPVPSEESKPLLSHQWLRALWVLFVFSIIGAFVGLGFFIQHQTLNNQDSVPCVSSACLRVAERLSSLADPFSRPCDYYLLSCGSEPSYLSRGRHRGKLVSREPSRKRGVRMRTDRDDLPERLPERLTALLRRMKEILESPVRSVSASRAELKARTFYKTCLDSDAVRMDSAERFLTLLQQLGGWPVSLNWKQSDFNSTLALLMARYNTFPFFNVYVGPDQSGSQRYIQIDEPDFRFPIEWNSQTHRSKIKLQALRPFFWFCRQLLSLFNVSSSSTTQHCGLYVSLSSTLVTNTSPLTHRLQQGHLYRRVTVQELQVLAPSIDWLGCFQALFYPVPVSASDVVLLQNLNYIVHMSQTITEWKHKYETTGSFPLHTYLMLTLLQNLIPVMDSSFIETMKNFSLAINSLHDVQDVPHWRLCVLQTVKGFDTLFHHLLKEEYETEQAEEMLRDVYSSFRTKLSSLKWRDKQTQDFVLNKVSFLTPRLSTHHEILHQVNLDQHYAEVVMSEEDFFSNYLELLVLQRRWRSRLFSPVPQPDVLSISPFVSSDNLIIPVGMFVSPMFHSTYPRAVNYAMLGTLIARDLLHLLLPDILSQSESPQQESACAWSHYLRATDGSSSLSLSQQQELWVHYSALQISLHSYNTSLQRNSRDSSVSGLSHLHLFITSFTQTVLPVDRAVFQCRSLSRTARVYRQIPPSSGVLVQSRACSPTDKWTQQTSTPWIKSHAAVESEWV